MVREIKIGGETFPAKFGFSTFMKIKADMSELESVACMCYYAIKTAAKREKPSILRDPRFLDLEIFADELFYKVTQNKEELEGITEAIGEAQKILEGDESGSAQKKRKQ